MKRHNSQKEKKKQIQKHGQSLEPFPLSKGWSSVEPESKDNKLVSVNLTQHRTPSLSSGLFKKIPAKKKFDVQQTHRHPRIQQARRLLKSGDTEGDEINQETVSIAQSMTDPGTIYSFRLSRIYYLTSSVGGVIDHYANNDPNASATEWASLITLFSMVRIRRVRFRVLRACLPAIGTTVTVGDWRPAVFALLYDDVGAPGGYATCLDAPNFKSYQYYADTTASGMEISLTYSGPLTPLWADTSSPVSATEYKGCPGCFQLYVDNVPASLVTFAIFQTLDIELMNRL